LGGLAKETGVGSMMENLTLTDEQTCNSLGKRLFDYYDKDGSASLEKQECGHMISDVYKLIGRQYPITDDDKDLMLNVLDTEKKGSISVKNFEDLMKRYLTP
jgi:Ca2+-binding EF-hand superfamily protein